MDSANFKSWLENQGYTVRDVNGVWMVSKDGTMVYALLNYSTHPPLQDQWQLYLDAEEIKRNLES